MNEGRDDAPAAEPGEEARGEAEPAKPERALALLVVCNTAAHEHGLPMRRTSQPYHYSPRRPSGEKKTGAKRTSPTNEGSTRNPLLESEGDVLIASQAIFSHRFLHEQSQCKDNAEGYITDAVYIEQELGEYIHISAAGGPNTTSRSTLKHSS